MRNCQAFLRFLQQLDLAVFVFFLLSAGKTPLVAAELAEEAVLAVMLFCAGFWRVIDPADYARQSNIRHFYPETKSRLLHRVNADNIVVRVEKLALVAESQHYAALFSFDKRAGERLFQIGRGLNKSYPD